MPESAIVRECALRFITRAGPEIGVASTKAFTTQLAALFLLTLVMAKVKQHLTPEQEAAYLDQLRHLPVAVHKVLELEDEIKAWAQRFADKQHALFLGRGRHYPIAMEGALKLKEISYIHAEAYPAGELKHGPLALVDANMPVISVAPNDQLLDKLKSNLKEVQAAAVNSMSSPIPTRKFRSRKASTSCACPSITANYRRSCTSFRCNCSRTTPRWSRAPMWTSRATWPRASPSNNGHLRHRRHPGLLRLAGPAA